MKEIIIIRLLSLALAGAGLGYGLNEINQLPHKQEIPDFQQVIKPVVSQISQAVSAAAAEERKTQSILITKYKPDEFYQAQARVDICSYYIDMSDCPKGGEN